MPKGVYQRKRTRKTIIRLLDKLISQIVILRDSRCVTCGTKQGLGCGHLFSRVGYSTRWDLDNCFAQCNSCNFKHEHDAYPLMNYAEHKYGKRKLDELHRKYVAPKKYQTYELEELYKEIKKKAMEDFGSVWSLAKL